MAVKRTLLNEKLSSEVPPYVRAVWTRVEQYGLQTVLTLLVVGKSSYFDLLRN